VRLYTLKPEMNRLGECFSDVDFKPTVKCRRRVIPYYPGDAALKRQTGPISFPQSIDECASPAETVAIRSSGPVRGRWSSRRIAELARIAAIGGRSSNGNGLRGQNSAGFLEIYATFQRDNLRRHF
jgi:hypothetical protein